MSLKDDFLIAVMDSLALAPVDNGFQLTPEQAILLGAVGVALEKVLENHKTIHNHFHPNEDQVLFAVGGVVRIEHRGDVNAEPTL